MIHRRKGQQLTTCKMVILLLNWLFQFHDVKQNPINDQAHQNQYNMDQLTTWVAFHFWRDSRNNFLKKIILNWRITYLSTAVDIILHRVNVAGSSSICCRRWPHQMTHTNTFTPVLSCDWVDLLADNTPEANRATTMEEVNTLRLSINSGGMQCASTVLTFEASCRNSILILVDLDIALVAVQFGNRNNWTW